MNRDQLGLDLAAILTEVQSTAISLCRNNLVGPPLDPEFLSQLLTSAISTGVADIETVLHDHGVLLHRGVYE